MMTFGQPEQSALELRCCGKIGELTVQVSVTKGLMQIIPDHVAKFGEHCAYPFEGAKCL